MRRPLRKNALQTPVLTRAAVLSSWHVTLAATFHVGELMQPTCLLTALYGALLLTGGCMHDAPEDSPQRKPIYREHHSVTGAKSDAPAQSPTPGSQDMLSRMGQDLQQRLGTPTSAFQEYGLSSTQSCTIVVTCARAFVSPWPAAVIPCPSQRSEWNHMYQLGLL